MNILSPAHTLRQGQTEFASKMFLLDGGQLFKMCTLNGLQKCDPMIHRGVTNNAKIN